MPPMLTSAKRYMRRSVPTGSSTRRPRRRKRPSRVVVAVPSSTTTSRRRPTRGSIAASSRATAAAPNATIVARLAAKMPSTSLPSMTASTQATAITRPPSMAIVFALQCIGALSSMTRPVPPNSTQVQPLPSIPSHLPPETVPFVACVVKSVEPKSRPRMPPASRTAPMIATGPLASDTPLVRSMVRSFEGLAPFFPKRAAVSRLAAARPRAGRAAALPLRPGRRARRAAGRRSPGPRPRARAAVRGCRDPRGGSASRAPSSLPYPQFRGSTPLLEHVRDRPAVVLEQRDHVPPRDGGAVERVDVLRPRTMPDVQPPRLKVRGVGRRRDLPVALPAGHPRLQVVLLGGGGAEVVGADVDHAV